MFIVLHSSKNFDLYYSYNINVFSFTLEYKYAFRFSKYEVALDVAKHLTNKYLINFYVSEVV